MLENLIIGSGVAGIATAMALREREAPFEVLDVGYDLEPDTDQVVSLLAGQEPQNWDQATKERLFPPPVTSSGGVERRRIFGSDFPYRVPDNLSVKMENCTTELSHGLGGFGNVWGGAMMPYNAHSLRDWPISKEELNHSYRNVLKYVPLSAEQDGLEENFPLHKENITTLNRSGQIEALITAFNRRKDRLAKQGVEFGRARVAVNSTADEKTCRYCGLCLDGCAYGSIFNPRLLWRSLTASGTKIHRGFYAMEFKEHQDHVEVTTVNTEQGTIQQWKTKRLYLASGHFATARMIARSLGRLGDTIRIPDSQYFFFPLLSYKAIHEDITFTLAEMFLEILNKDISDNYLHFQLYGLNQIFSNTLRAMLPGPVPLAPLTSRFYLFQGYMHSADSGHLELELTSSGPTSDEITIRGVENPAALLVAKRAQSMLRKCLLTFGIIPPLAPELVPPGRSFHTGGSFPIGGGHSIYASDDLGRPAGLKRIHIADSANFPTVASSTIGFTIMANADRIVRASADL